MKSAAYFFGSWSAGIPSSLASRWSNAVVSPISTRSSATMAAVLTPLSDKTVSVVKFETPTGTPIAIMFNYAMHSNSITGESTDLIYDNIAGNAELFIEHQHKDKVVALWSS